MHLRHEQFLSPLHQSVDFNKYVFGQYDRLSSSVASSRVGGSSTGKAGLRDRLSLASDGEDLKVK